MHWKKWLLDFWHVWRAPIKLPVIASLFKCHFSYIYAALFTLGFCRLSLFHNFVVSDHIGWIHIIRYKLTHAVHLLQNMTSTAWPRRGWAGGLQLVSLLVLASHISHIRVCRASSVAASRKAWRITAQVIRTAISRRSVVTAASSADSRNVTKWECHVKVLIYVSNSWMRVSHICPFCVA